MSDEQGKKSINWGGLIKGLAAGAAVVAGVMLVAPGLLPSIVEGISGMIGSTGGGASFLSSGVGEVITKVAGAAMAITGLSYLFGGKSDGDNADRHSQQYHEAKESFAIREDMRKMQAVMTARMAASGHQPAMALASQQGRA
jgi:hypothetical protein